MKWLHRRRRDFAGTGELGDEAAPTTCEHAVLIATRQGAEDAGREDVVSSYRCETCGKEFTRYEAERLRLTCAVRLRRSG